MCKIKICGLRSRHDADIVNTCLPDYAGFVFVPSSKRFVTPKQALEIRQVLDTKIKTVGVFQNADKKDIINAVSSCIIDVIQLHGEEDQNYIDSLKNLGCQVIKAYMIKDRIPPFLKSDYILLDNFAGGSGQSFDWRKINFELNNTFLAGGINLKNIRKAKAYKPYCIDISSGAEIGGKKDKTLIKELIKAVRNG